MKSTKPLDKPDLPAGRGGISIILLSVILFLTAFLAVTFSFIELRQAVVQVHSLYELEQQRQKCDQAIQQFMDGSDYLTAQVQQLVVKSDRSYMDNYWQEVYETKSRDLAVQIILDADITPAERAAALAGKSESDSLIQGEIWAMRLIAESIGLAEKDMPQAVAACQLEPAEAALSAAQKQEAAVDYVFGPDYSTAKSVIRSNVNAFRSEITGRYSAEALKELTDANDSYFYMAVGSIVFFILLLGAIICFTRQVVTPLLGFSHYLDSRKEGQPIALKESGALEIRRFARAFNELSLQVEQNTKRLERLSYVDFLTDVPNRASITGYVEGLIAAGKVPLGFLVIDIDNFKRFNDTYGHALGDVVLRQVAQAICSVQSAEGGLSGRICGEEFVIVVQNADEAVLEVMAAEILQNVRSITGDDVGLAAVSDFRITVSIGGMIWQGELPADFSILLSRADKALYESKRTGKDKYSFNEAAIH